MKRVSLTRTMARSEVLYFDETCRCFLSSRFQDYSAEAFARNSSEIAMMRNPDIKQAGGSHDMPKSKKLVDAHTAERSLSRKAHKGFLCCISNGISWKSTKCCIKFFPVGAVCFYTSFIRPFYGLSKRTA